MLTDLSRRERQLVDAARRGDMLTCSELTPDQLRDTEEPDHLVRGQILRDLLLGRHGELDPLGVRIARARVTGEVDLNYVDATTGLNLTYCTLDQPVKLRGSHFPWLYMLGTHLPTMEADGVRIDGDLVLGSGFEAFNDTLDGIIRLRGGHIAGSFSMNGAELTNTSGPAISADRLRVDGSIFLRNGFTATGNGTQGTIRLASAQIASDLEMDSAELTNTSGPALNANQLRVGGSIFLRNGFTATGNGKTGTIFLIGADVAGSLEMDSAKLTNTSGPALNANQLRVGGSIFLRNGFTATTDSASATIFLLGARVTVSLEMDSAELTNSSGPALNGNRLQVGGSIFLRNGFTAAGNGESGTIFLLGAHVAGSLEMDSAKLTNTSGPALNGNRLRIDGDLLMRNGFIAATDSASATIFLLGAHVAGSLEMDSAKLTNTSGPALSGDWLRVDGSILLRNGFTATGNGESGTMFLRGANITGQISMIGANLINRDHNLLLNLESSRCSMALMSAELICPRGSRTNSTCEHSNRWFGVNGFTYDDLRRSDWKQWLHLIRWHTEAYNPTSYQQLAEFRATAGHDRDTRTILISQQTDHRVRGDLGGLSRRITHTLWGALAGYGYQSGRIAVALLVVFLLAVGASLLAGHTTTSHGHHAAEHTSDLAGTAAPGPCSSVELIGLGIDRGLPLASTGIRAHCDLDTSSTAGQWFTFAIWLLQGAMWALATLALAGYTGLIRKVH
jgi:sRNA-binding regulator protein Hfq